MRDWARRTQPYTDDLCARRIPFQQVLSLVSRRKVFLRKGMAYVPFKNLQAILLTKVLLMSPNAHRVSPSADFELHSSGSSFPMR